MGWDSRLSRAGFLGTLGAFGYVVSGWFDPEPLRRCWTTFTQTVTEIVTVTEPGPPPPMPQGSALPARMAESDGTVIYVDSASGSNSNAGTSIGAPKQTMDGGTGAFAVVSSNGGRIQLRNNASHSLSTDTVPVTLFGQDEDHPITIETYPGDLDTNQPLGSARGFAQITSRMKFWPGDGRSTSYNSGNGFNMRLQNLDFTGPGTTSLDSLWIGNAINFELYNVLIHNGLNGQSGANINGISRSGQTLSSSISSGLSPPFTRDVSSAANFQDTGAFYVLIDAEIFHVSSLAGTTLSIDARAQNGTTAAAHSAGATVFLYTRGDNVQVINALVHDNGRNNSNGWQHDHGLYYGSDYGVTNGAIYNVASYLNMSHGIQLYENADGVVISHVTLDENGRNGIIFGGESSSASDNVTLKNFLTTNNLDLPGTGGYGIDTYWGTFGNGTGNVADNGYHFNNLNGGNRGGESGLTITNYANTNPGYVNQPSGDFNLSAPIGGSDTAYSPSFDIDGTFRPPGAEDMGAYQVGTGYHGRGTWP